MDEITKNDLARNSTRLMPIERVTLANLVTSFFLVETGSFANLENYIHQIKDDIIKGYYIEFLRIFYGDNLNEKEQNLHNNMKEIFTILKVNYNIDNADIANHFISTHYFYYPTWFYNRTKVYGRQTQTQKFFFNLFEKKSTVNVVIDEPYGFIHTMMQEHPELFIKRPSQSGFINEYDL